MLKLLYVHLRLICGDDKSHLRRHAHNSLPHKVAFAEDNVLWETLCHRFLLVMVFVLLYPRGFQS